MFEFLDDWIVQFNKSEAPLIEKEPEEVVSIEEESDEEKSIREDKIEPLFKHAAIYIINECVQQLNILTTTFSQVVDQQEPELLRYKELKERFNGQMTKQFEANFDFDVENIDCFKIQKEIGVISVMMQKLYDEIESSDTYETLLQFNSDVINMKTEDEQLLMEYVANRKVFKSLQNDMHQSIYKCKNAKRDTAEATSEVLTAIEAESHRAKDLIQYQQKWDDTRIEQNTRKVTEKEQGYEKFIENTSRDMGVENFCHEEIERYLTETKEDYTNDIETWMNRYDEEIEKMDTNIYNMKMQQEKLAEDHEALKVEFERQQREMEEWLEYKKIKAEKDYEIACAIRIQAWWRGVMYRKKLGPYRKKKKGKGKGKKDKKGKKK